MDIVGRREPTFRHILKDLHQLNSEGGYPAGHVGVGLLADVVVKGFAFFNSWRSATPRLSPFTLSSFSSYLVQGTVLNIEQERP
jgi:hypothetical protein